MIIRPEEKQDFNEIYTVVKAAFATAEHSDGNEQDLVIALRTGNNYIQKLFDSTELGSCKEYKDV